MYMYAERTHIFEYVEMEWIKFIGTSLIFTEFCPYLLTLNGDRSVVDECLSLCEVRELYVIKYGICSTGKQQTKDGSSVLHCDLCFSTNLRRTVWLL